MGHRLLQGWVVMVLPVLAACGAVGPAPELEIDLNPSQGTEIAETSPDGAIAGQHSDAINGIMAPFDGGPGGAVMVIQGGEIIHQQGYGWADVDQERAITPETAFHLGSVGKQLTAMGVLILVERGAVDLDEPISTYIPELAWMDGEVTVRRLLHHTSGVMGYDDNDEIYEALLALSPIDNEAVVTAISQFPTMLADPGEEFHYSNTGYDLLGLLIERVSGQSYGRFMEATIFAPLGMADTFALPSDRRFGDSVAQSYGSSGPYEPDVLDAVNGSGSVYSTLGDLYRYDQALSAAALVSPDLMAEMFTSGSLNDGEATGYGFGFELATYGGYDYEGHQGSWLGFDTYYLRIPAADLSVVVLLNLEDGDPDAEEIAFAIADLHLRE